MPEAIYNTVVYFKNVYEEEWILSERAREMIEDIATYHFVRIYSNAYRAFISDASNREFPSIHLKIIEKISF